MGITTNGYVQARWHYEGRARRVRLCVIHATQSPERKGAARAVANYFATTDTKASAHVTVDAAETIGSVKPADTAFAAPKANADGFHVEQVGYSEQLPVDWADNYSQMVIRRAAVVVVEACDLFGLPREWLTAAQVRDGKAGITDHNTCSIALGGSHWDPGSGYPRDLIMDLVRGGPPPLPHPGPSSTLELIAWL